MPRLLCYALLAAMLLVSTSILADVHLYEPRGLARDSMGWSISELYEQADDPGSTLGLLVGAPFFDGLGLDRGRVHFWFGGTDLTLRADLILTGEFDENFGFAVNRVGDVDNDGFDDFAVGAPRYSLSGLNNGRVYVYSGGPDVGTLLEILEGEEPVTGFVGSLFGYCVWAAGDFNGDGIDDLIVGAPYANAPGLEQGAALIYYGHNGGPSRIPDLILTGEIAGDHFGWSVCGAGNFFGGAEDAVVVGAPGHPQRGIEAGAAYVFRGGTPLFPPNPDHDAKLVSNAVSAAYGHFGFAVRNAHRWSGDAFDDIAIGVPNYFDGNPPVRTPGRVELFFGGTAPDTITDRAVVGEIQDDYFGYSLDGVWDIQGSGQDDLVIGAPGHDLDGFDAGKAYLYLGGSSATDASDLVPLYAAGIQPGSLPGDFYGAMVSGAGDFDGDGQGDLVVGAPLGNIQNNVEAGYAHLLDTSGTVTPTFLMDWSSAWARDGRVHLEFSLADGVNEVSWLSVRREVLVAADPVGSPFTVYDGPPLNGSASLRIEGDRWILEDRPAPLPANGALVYDLDFLMADGQVIQLHDLAGPTVPPVALRPELLPPHPNPFNPQTVVSFRAPAGVESVCRVVDMRGWHVATLYSGRASGYWQEVPWNGRTDDGRAVPAGIYLVQVISGAMSDTRRVVLAK